MVKNDRRGHRKSCIYDSYTEETIKSVRLASSTNLLPLLAAAQVL